jgi:metal-responsive CopG/Arc/MetJ family transcriptional regulator
MYPGRGKKVLIHFVQGMLDEMEELAKKEHRNRSELIREAVRDYIQNAKKEIQNLQQEKWRFTNENRTENRIENYSP